MLVRTIKMPGLTFSDSAYYRHSAREVSMRKAFRMLAVASLVFLIRCSEPVESILLLNDTDHEIELTYHNVTIASTESLVFKPGDRATIGLKGVWSASSAERLREYIAEYLVVRVLKTKPKGPVFSGEAALRMLEGGLKKEGDAWVIRFSSIFG
jgi:hypothetical protein